jgi:hypothetical protein
MAEPTFVLVESNPHSKYMENPIIEEGPIEPLYFYGRYYPDYNMSKGIVTFHDSNGDITYQQRILTVYDKANNKLETNGMELISVRPDIPLTFYITILALSTNILGPWVGALRINGEEKIIGEVASGHMFQIQKSFTELMQMFGDIRTYGGYAKLKEPADPRFETTTIADYPITLLPQIIESYISLSVKGDLDAGKTVAVYGHLDAKGMPLSGQSIKIMSDDRTITTTTDNQGYYHRDLILPNKKDCVIQASYDGKGAHFNQALGGYVKIMGAGASKSIKMDSFIQNIMQMIFGGKERTLSNTGFKTIGNR